MNTDSNDPRSQLRDAGELITLLDSLAGVGYGASLRPSAMPGSLVCGACRSVSNTADFGDFWASRCEGESDPDDMVLVVAARCPICGHGGSVVLGFGPLSSPEDAAIVTEVPDYAMRAAHPRA